MNDDKAASKNLSTFVDCDDTSKDVLNEDDMLPLEKSVTVPDDSGQLATMRVWTLSRPVSFPADLRNDGIVKKARLLANRSHTVTPLSASIR